jgi:hypothetical protein
MQFISKRSNWSLLLRTGRDGMPHFGVEAIPPIAIHFVENQAVIANEDIIQLALSSPFYGVEFFKEDEAPLSIGVSIRKNATKHVITEIEGGEFKGRKGPTAEDEQKLMEELISKEVEIRAKKLEEKYRVQTEEAIAKAMAIVENLQKENLKVESTQADEVEQKVVTEVRGRGSKK